ncbi:unnamed protein product, partial [Thlaspi arvense]
MVKHGGTKRKIPMEKIGKKGSLATAFTKRKYGLYSKASQLSYLYLIAVLATPPSSHSNVYFYSFGHSSVDAVVSAFLSGNRPAPVREETREEDIGICLARKELGLGLWWEEDALARSENLEELTESINSISTLLSKLKELREGESFCDHNHQRDHSDEKNKPDQTLILQRDHYDEKSMPDHTLILQRYHYDEKSMPDQTLILKPGSPICRSRDDLPSDYKEIAEEQSAVCDTEENNNKDMGFAGNYQEMDIDQLIDFETVFDTPEFDAWLLEGDQMLPGDLFNTIAAV